ncbi:pyridoxal-dependent decarboxylase [Saccharopolyspora sp. NPDC050642]|uniref:pyridoxal-dependent decarboxylase n=1 Tax=Saccharopolyspora sp. NPDC050642 TaxID=3157099 RepID=UPI0033F40BE4
MTAQEPPKLDDKSFELSRKGLSDKERTARLGELKKYLDYYQEHFLGYQVNQDLHEIRDDLSHFLGVHTNNIGDPYVDSNLATHTKPLEKAVLKRYAELWGIGPHDASTSAQAWKSAWGYVLSMGSSEGNVYGLLNARDYLSGKILLANPGADPGLLMSQAAVSAPYLDTPIKRANALQPVAFFSQDSHYSVAKAAHTLAIPTFGEVGNKYYSEFREYETCGYQDCWPAEIPSNEDGSINVERLVTTVDFFARRGHPVLVVCNLGTTFKGAYDNVGHIAQRLQKEVFDHYSMGEREFTVNTKGGKPIKGKRRAFWIHVDGALGASYLPYLKKAHDAGLLDGEQVDIPDFDFRVEQVSSIVTSGHKYPGSPWACGIYMTRRKFQIQPPPMAAYVASPDTTFGGSRNGFSPIVLWNQLAKHPEEEQVRRIAQSVKLARQTYHKLKELGKQLGKDLRPGYTPETLSVQFLQPNKHIVRKYSLASVPIDETTTMCHMFVMPHVTDGGALKNLLEDLETDGTAFEQDGTGGQASPPVDYQASETAEWQALLGTDRGFM